MRPARFLLFIACAAISLPIGVHAQAQAQPANDAVLRQEYERVIREQEQMRRELNALKRERDQPATHSEILAPSDSAEIHRQIEAVRDDVDRYKPGFSQFLIAGDAAVGFTTQRRSNSTFDAGVAPLLLWQPSERLFIEAAFDISGSTDIDGSSSTDFSLTLANVSYEMTDWLTIGGGVFIAPFGQYHNHFDPPWINKLPDDPLPFGDGGIAPGSILGAFARGAMPVGPMKLTYDLYVTNGPNLIVSDPAAAGTLAFDNFADLNDSKAVGGRIGLLPMPNLELGYSIMYGRAEPAGFQPVRALLQAFDLNWQQEVDPLKGRIQFQTEWVWSNVSRAVYDRRGTLGFGPLSFSNYRQGGYVQIAYRPVHFPNPIVRNLEGVIRWDTLHQPTRAPGGEVEQRWTLGLDYWITPQAVLKAAYKFDRRRVDRGADAFMIQFGVGL